MDSVRVSNQSDVLYGIQWEGYTNWWHLPADVMPFSIRCSPVKGVEIFCNEAKTNKLFSRDQNFWWGYENAGYIVRRFKGCWIVRGWRGCWVNGTHVLGTAATPWVCCRWAVGLCLLYRWLPPPHIAVCTTHALQMHESGNPWSQTVHKESLSCQHSTSGSCSLH